MPTVSGAVTTPAGQPCPGVYVYACDQADPRRRVAAHTDSVGRWTLELPAGTWTVREVGHGTRTVEVGEADQDTAAPELGGSLPGRAALADALARRRAAP